MTNGEFYLQTWNLQGLDELIVQKELTGAAKLDKGIGQKVLRESQMNS